MKKDHYIVLDRRFPVELTYFIVALCVAPFILTLLGVDFSSPKQTLSFLELSALSSEEQLESTFLSASGALTHTILEWTAFCLAIVTYILAFAHYRIGNNPTTPIIATALFCAGCIDAFHTLAAGRLIDAVADNNNLIPFTWAISRTFNAVILLIGAGILFAFGQRKYKISLKFIWLVSLLFFALAFVIVEYCATSAQLPQTMYPDNFITRPWDVAPLLLYLVGGLIVFPLYYRLFPSIFAFSLIVSMIPDVATELHMAFGSKALFDSHFNIAHYLKIIAYAVPFFGLVLDYIYTYEKQRSAQETLQVEQSLRRRAESVSEQILDNALESIISIDGKGTILSVNRATENLFGYSPEELLKQNIKMLMPSPYQDKHDGYLSSYHELGRGVIIDSDTSSRELSGARKDGSTFPMELSLSILEVEEGKIFTGVIRDITQRKARLKSLEESAKSLQRSNEELERFAYIASHDLQEPLRMVASYTNLLSKRYKDKLDDDANDFIGFAVDGATRMQNLIQDLLSFSRLGTKTKEHSAVDTQKLTEQILHDLQILIEEQGCEVNFDELPTITAEPSQMRQLFQNLINNAIKYSDKKNGRVNSIRISAEQVDDCWKFAISDTGIGIEEKHFDGIFEIFKRLHSKAAYSGTGLGLALCRRIVEMHKGDIWVESEPDKGSTFYFTLPMK